MSDSDQKPLVIRKEGETTIITRPSQTKVSTPTGTVKEGKSNLVDLVFTIDTTGSMNDKIDALLHTVSQFVKEAESFDLDMQFALISFGDISVQGGGDRIDVVVPLTNNIGRMQAGLAQIPRNNGFGNEGETPLEAIAEALNLSYRKRAVKVLVLITDEPAVEYHYRRNEMIKTLKTKEFLVFVLAIDTPYYRAMAKENGGVWKEISASSNLSELLTMFRNLAKKVSQVAKAVYQVGGGSVSKYLLLKPPEDDK